MAPVAHTTDSLAPDTKWGKLNYVNPPFNNIGRWLAKAVEQYLANGSCSVFLIPLRPHRLYFQRYSAHYSFVEYLAEGVIFKGYKKPIPHSMCLLGIGIPSAARPGLVPFGNFYLHKSSSKYTISGMAATVKADFAVKADIKICVSVKDIPCKDYIVALISNNMRNITEDLTKYTVIVPGQLYRDGLAGRFFNGSVLVIDPKSAEPTGSAYCRVPHVFVNKEYTN